MVTSEEQNMRQSSALPISLSYFRSKDNYPYPIGPLMAMMCLDYRFIEDSFIDIFGKFSLFLNHCRTVSTMRGWWR